MFKTILLPTDGSDLSQKATATAIQFAQLNQAGIVAVYVVQPVPLTPMADGSTMLDAGAYDQQMQTAAEEVLDKVRTAAQAASVPFEGVIALSPRPADEIVDAANKYHCDVIVMGSHGRTGLNKLLVGSETEKVLAHTTLPVLVVR
jgi:nucleotide-binding universal stress UspA family protein